MMIIYTRESKISLLDYDLTSNFALCTYISRCVIMDHANGISYTAADACILLLFHSSEPVAFVYHAIKFVMK